MAYYDQEIQDAKAMIAEFGETCTLVVVTEGTAPDEDKPLDKPEAAEAEHSVSAVFLNLNLQTSGETFLNGLQVKDGDKKALVAGLDAQDITPSDRIVRADGSVWQVMSAKLLDPNGQKILWTLVLRQ